ncbi:MAG: hypothetical protein HFG54_07675 [Lachnospiraceae bacterium]|jgi:hypothetical protein|nr:hypothetical protein [Lachnospiraceae bacterium]
MKTLDDILSACSDMEELIKGRIIYGDSLPGDSSEMPFGDSIRDKIQAMKYFDGTMEAFDDLDGKSLWKTIYDKIWKINFNEKWIPDGIFLDEKQTETALKLYFALEPVKKDTYGGQKKSLMEAFEKMFAVLYLKYGNQTEGYEKLKNIAYQAYQDFKDIRDIVDRQMENKSSEDDHFLPVRKVSESYNRWQGIRIEEVRDDREEMGKHLGEAFFKENGKEESWFSKHFGGHD